MNTIRDAHFDFDMDVSGEEASTISQRAMEILQERLDTGPGRPAIIENLEVDEVELPQGEAPESAAQRIAGAVYSSIRQRTLGGKRA
jgi:hypothetical protein